MGHSILATSVGSYEGSGLSVSINPEEWRQIARGHVYGDLWRCTRAGNHFLNLHRVTKTQKKKIRDWAVDNQYAVSASVWRYSYYDEDEETERYFEFRTREEAEAEVNEDVPGKITEIAGSLTATTKFNQRAMTDDQIIDFGILATIWAEDTTDLDGVWWADRLQPENLSAPKGVIVPSRISYWDIKKA